MTHIETLEISVAKNFSRFPAGIKKTDGPYSGEVFREMLTEALRLSSVSVLMDGTMGFSSSFLKEAFGGLLTDFTAKDLHERLLLTASDKSLITEVWGYIDGGPSLAAP
jgi:hypothetical protein